MDTQTEIREALYALRDEAILLIKRSGKVERRLNSRWKFVREWHEDLRQDVYLRLLELWQRPDRRELVRDAISNPKTLAAIVDMTVKESLRTYGTPEQREIVERDAVFVEYADMVEEVKALVRFLPPRERAIYSQWIDSRYNTAELAAEHRVSKAFMCRYIAQLNLKINEIWRKFC